MAFMMDVRTREELLQRAYEAFDAGDLTSASRRFADLLEASPEQASHHYMRGLAHKYLRDWRTSLTHNLRSSELQNHEDEASLWNAGIAATALGEWSLARQQWQRCGMSIPSGDGAIDANFGSCCVRLNPWAEGEVVHARRIDVVRARIVNVPLPESGFRFGDIVLHDGAEVGERRSGDVRLPVFNVLQLLDASPFRTHAVFVRAPTRTDLLPLIDSRAPGIGAIEDWTDSVRHICLRCSHGVAHHHADRGQGDGDWERDRSIGIAAQGRAAVERILKAWASAGTGRIIDGIELRECSPPAPPHGIVWWLGMDDAAE